MTSYYVDTNIFLNVIYKEQGFYKESVEFLRQIHKGKFHALTSSVTLLEVILDMAESGYFELASKAVASIEDMRNLEIVSLSKTMTKQAAAFVVRDKLTIHDAYHIATALCMKTEAFVTRDEELKRKIAEYIKITTPEEIRQKTPKR
jgi:predicted nucleic acid-binding protein